MSGEAQQGLVDQHRARDYLNDEVARAFFSAREHEAYYRSLKSVDQRRAFHDALLTELRHLIEVATGGAIHLIDDILRRSQPRTETTAGVASKTVSEEGRRLLGVDESVDFDGLREAYRAAALQYHPDRGGSNEAMTAVNLAYEQFHAAITDRVASDDGGPSPSEGALTASDYLWSVKRLMFEVLLDDWELEAALELFDQLLAALSGDHGSSASWRRVGLIEPGLKLAERLTAADRRDQAQHVLALTTEGVGAVKEAGLNYQYFEGLVQKSRAVVDGQRPARFTINHPRQLKNAHRLGAVDDKRYATIFARLDQRSETPAAADADEEALLQQTRFVTNLPTDTKLTAGGRSDRLVPDPGYYESRADDLTPDQQAEYVQAFSNNEPQLALVHKYAWVRLGSLLRSGLQFVDSVDLCALRDEAHTMRRLQPKCDYYGEKVARLLDRIADLDPGGRRAAITAIQELLSPADVRPGVMVLRTIPELSPAFLDPALNICAQVKRDGR
jgi:hypothetical protein